MPERRIEYMCPHCGWRFDALLAHSNNSLVPAHEYPLGSRQSCQGSNQTPRNPDSDRRPLWKDMTPAKDEALTFKGPTQAEREEMKRLNPVLAADLDALRKELEDSLADLYGLTLHTIDADRGEYALRDNFGPVAAVHSDALRRVEGGLAKQRRVIACADAILRENKRLRAELTEWRRLRSAVEAIAQSDLLSKGATS